MIRIELQRRIQSSCAASIEPNDLEISRLGICILSFLNRYFFLVNKETLLIRIEAIVSVQKAFAIAGNVSSSAAQSFASTQRASRLYHAQSVRAVSDRLIKRNHFASRWRSVKQVFKMALTIAAVPRIIHMSFLRKIKFNISDLMLSVYFSGSPVYRSLIRGD